MNTSSQKLLQQKLQKIINEHPNSIQAIVSKEALSRDNIVNFFRDLIHHGCQSGMISFLIYYIDTHNFFDENYTEIEELREEYESSIGESIRVKGDLKNFYAWFAFEQVAHNIVQNINLEL